MKYFHLCSTEAEKLPFKSLLSDSKAHNLFINTFFKRYFAILFPLLLSIL